MDDQLRRMLSSQTFSQAPRSARLLRYLIEHSLVGRPGEVKEYAVGVHVFDRGPDFDPRTDSIVRVQARRLRQRLDAYYADEGRDDPFLIDIPTGHYRVQVRARQPDAPPAARTSATDADSVAQRRWRLWTAVAALSVITAAAITIYWDNDPTAERQAAGIGDPQAETAYLRGLFFHNRRGPGDPERARQQLEQAVALDPQHARAWAALSGAYGILGGMAGRPDRAPLLAAQGRAARTSVAVDPGLAEARVRLGHYWRLIGDEAAAVAEYRDALRLDPDNVMTMGAVAASFLHVEDLRQPIEPADLEASLELMRRSSDRDPVSIVHRYNVASLLMLMGRLDEARQEFLAIQELLPAVPVHEFHSAEEGLARVLVLLGRWDEALEVVTSWPEGRERERYLTMIHHGLGDTDQANPFIDQRRDAFTSDDEISVGEVLAFVGDRDGAFEWLERVTEQIRADENLLPTERRWLLRDLSLSPYLVSLTDDPRWPAWLQRAQAATAPGGGVLAQRIDSIP